MIKTKDMCKKKITKRETLHVKYIQEGKKLFIQVIGVF